VARDLCGIAALQPRWTRSGPERRGKAMLARAKPERRGGETGEGRGPQRQCCPRRDTFEHCSSVYGKGWAVPKRGPKGWGVGVRVKGVRAPRPTKPQYETWYTGQDA